MNLTAALKALGMGDGNNETSSHRLISVLIIVAWLSTKVYASFKAGVGMAIDAADVGLVATILGLGAVKTVAEQTTVTVGKPTTPEPEKTEKTP
jgi:hypothetical protein